MSFLTDPKQLEKLEDKELAEGFIQSLEKELKIKKEDDIVEELTKAAKAILKDHPYLVGLIVGIILAKYTNISKKLEI